MITSRYASGRSSILLCALGVLCGSVAFAQNYRCDWSVLGQGGGGMASTAYLAGATVGQTAVGSMADNSYQAFIGFWQTDAAQVGIQEDAGWPAAEPLVTKLYAPFPNPCRTSATIRYSLARPGPVSLKLYDISGKLVQTLASGQMPVGAASHKLQTSSLAGGVYLIRLETESHTLTRKLIVE